MNLLLQQAGDLASWIIGKTDKHLNLNFYSKLKFSFSLTKVLPSFKLFNSLSSYSHDQKLSFLFWHEFHVEIHNCTLINWIWWKEGSFLTHFFLGPLIWFSKSERYIECHIFYLHSVWSHYFAKNCVDQALLLDSCIILTKDKSNNCFIIQNYFRVKNRCKLLPLCS